MESDIKQLKLLETSKSDENQPFSVLWTLKSIMAI